MQLVFDEAKRIQNIAKHGGVGARLLSLGSFLDAHSGRRKAIGEINGEVVMQLRDLTDEEETQIQRQIASDPDTPEATDAELASARPFTEVFPEMAEAIRRGRGRPRVEAPKEAVRIAPETLARFQATGTDWRARMNKVLDSAKL